MKHELALHYYIQNCGDGSASVTFVENKALADFDQNQDDGENGWGEPCTGVIHLESDSPIVVKTEVVSVHKYFLRLVDNEDDNKIVQFMEVFYPGGRPTFRVEIDSTYTNDKYCYNNVFVEDVQVAHLFRCHENSGKALEEKLNTPVL